VEDQENGLVLLGSNGILNILLVFAKQLWVQLDITRLVNTMDISETSSDREVRRDGRQSLVDLKNVFGLGVK
jgi:hypothetical protein